MPEISSQAQAVFHAFNSKFDWIEDGVPGPQYKAIAAALRAAVDQLTPYTVSEMEGAAFARNKLLAIAAELEAQ